MGRGRSRSAPIAYGACALCVAVALLALMWARGQASTAAPAPGPAATEETDLDDSWLADLTRWGSRALRSGVEDSSGERFLGDLERQAGEAVDGDGVVAVAWEVPGDLVEPAAQVLRAYAAEPTSSLETSGYLDLKGNAWGAIVLDRRGWVDIVYVTCADDAGSTVVRIARMLAAKEAV